MKKFLLSASILALITAAVGIASPQEKISRAELMRRNQRNATTSLPSVKETQPRIPNAYLGKTPEAKSLNSASSSQIKQHDIDTIVTKSKESLVEAEKVQLPDPASNRMMDELEVIARQLLNLIEKNRNSINPSVQTTTHQATKALVDVVDEIGDVERQDPQATQDTPTVINNAQTVLNTQATEPQPTPGDTPPPLPPREPLAPPSPTPPPLPPREPLISTEKSGDQGSTPTGKDLASQLKAQLEKQKKPKTENEGTTSNTKTEPKNDGSVVDMLKNNPRFKQLTDANDHSDDEGSSDDEGEFEDDWNTGKDKKKLN